MSGDRNSIQRAQLIVKDVFDDRPDLDEREQFIEFERRVHDPNYVPKAWR